MERCKSLHTSVPAVEYTEFGLEPKRCLHTEQQYITSGQQKSSKTANGDQTKQQDYPAKNTIDNGSVGIDYKLEPIEKDGHQQQPTVANILKQINSGSVGAVICNNDSFNEPPIHEPSIDQTQSTKGNRLSCGNIFENCSINHLQFNKPNSQLTPGADQQIMSAVAECVDDKSNESASEASIKAAQLSDGEVACTKEAAIQSVGKNTSTYTCSYCKLHFKKQIVYNIHMQLHKMDASFVGVKTKPTPFKTVPMPRHRDVIMPHHRDILVTRQQNVSLSCVECGEVFEVYKTFEIHQLRDHSNYICSICLEPFKEQSALEKHKHNHETAPNVTCSFCKKSFCYQKSLAKHINFKHGKEFRNTSKIVPSMQVLTKAQEKVPSVSCSGTGESSRIVPRTTVLIKAKEKVPHIASSTLTKESGMRFRCPICSKHFKFRCSLGIHMQSKHNHPYKSDSMLGHTEDALKLDEQPEKQVVLGKNTTQCYKFQCTVCHFVCYKKSFMYNHIETHGIHQMLFTYKCVACEYASNNASKLICHIQHHGLQIDHIPTKKLLRFLKNSTATFTGFDPNKLLNVRHQCVYCPCSFKCEDNYFSHMKSHGIIITKQTINCRKTKKQAHKKEATNVINIYQSGDNKLEHFKKKHSYSCKVCGEKSSSKRYIANHIRRKHNDEVENLRSGQLQTNMNQQNKAFKAKLPMHGQESLNRTKKSHLATRKRQNIKSEFKTSSLHCQNRIKHARAKSGNVRKQCVVPEAQRSCEYCKKVFHSTHVMYRHVRQVHSKENSKKLPVKARCNICGIYTKKLSVHMMVIHCIRKSSRSSTPSEKLSNPDFTTYSLNSAPDNPKRKSNVATGASLSCD